MFKKNANDKKSSKAQPNKSKNKTSVTVQSALWDNLTVTSYRDLFPKEFPFWARLKINKNRPTLVIDEAPALDKRKNEMVDGFVHREVIHTKKVGDYEEISPNPDPKDPDSMYLKRPSKTPQFLFKPHEGGWSMPEYLKQRYDKNNHKDENSYDKKS